MEKIDEASNDIFFSNKETIEKILRIAKETKTSVEEPVFLEKFIDLNLKS